MQREETKNLREERILVCIADSGEAADVQQILEQNGFRTEICLKLDRFCEAMLEGAGAGFISDDFLKRAEMKHFVRCMMQQPAWSDLPLIMATEQEEVPAFFDELEENYPGGNLILLDRPICELKLC